jgi:hypothetical protein
MEERNHMRFPSGTMKIHNAKTGMVEKVPVKQCLVTDLRIHVDPFLLQACNHLYEYEAKAEPDGRYNGNWKCRDGRSGPLKNCNFDRDRLTITGVMVEGGCNYNFEIELDEEED